jgi:pyridinium-3,5-biscarboxylic acid mononucleotide sulfurtransferase
MTRQQTWPDGALSTAARFDRLVDILRDCGSVCIGYSGGVDSVFLAKVAVDVLGPGSVLAVTGRSAAYPDVQRSIAIECAHRFGIPHLEIETDELEDPHYAANPANRCYYCKSELWPKLVEVARGRGLGAVLDGSNADDVGDYRPGSVAAREHGVRSPLVEAGLTKRDIRELSRQQGLPTWDQPAAPCLSSRLPYGVAVTPDRLHQVELAEAALRELGFRELRVRHHDDCLRLELAPAELPAAIEQAGAIERRLSALRLPPALLDVEGYRRGALNEALVQIGQTAGPAAASAAASGSTHEAGAVAPAFRVAGFHGDIVVPAHTDAQAARTAAPTLRAAGFRYVALDLGALAAARIDHTTGG